MATYYVANNGDDTRTAVQAQNIATPWKTWQKGTSVLVAGDTLFIRGGTYTSPFAPEASDWLITIANLTGTSTNPIIISAYPGEQPLFDLTGFAQLRNTTCVRVNRCSWVQFIGLWVKNAIQLGTNPVIVAGWDFHECNDITMNRCWVDNIWGAGIRQSQINGSDTIPNARFTYINCDSSHNGDANNTGGGGVYGNADGFDCNTGTAVYINCRAWGNSDDGFDTFTNDSLIEYHGCWSFWNGFVPSSVGIGGLFTDPGVAADGMGFKWGVTTSNLNTTHLKTYTRCISFQNKSWGFDQNNAMCIAWFYNNTSFSNHFHNTSSPSQFSGGGWATGYSSLPASVLKNNISFSDSTIVSNFTNLNETNNSWDAATNATPTAGSFLSIDPTGVDGPRAADGSLPVLNFLKLAVGSNQIDKGVADTNFVALGLTFSGSAPDLGAYEFSSATTTPAPYSFGTIMI